MKVLLLNGSMARKSHTKILLLHIETLFKEKQVETIFWDLKEKPLPYVDPFYHHDPYKNPDLVVKEFVSIVLSVDGIVLGSPLYHGSYSGVLKNAIDNLGPDGFRDKWIGFAGNAGGARADHVQHTHLRNVVKTLYGYATQTQVGTHKGDYKEHDDRYELIDDDIKARCLRLVDEMIKLLSIWTKTK